MDDRQKWTYETIVARCADLIPPVDLPSHIKSGTRRTAKNTLDGITFEAVDPDRLANEFSGRKALPNFDKLPKPAPGAIDTRYAARPANASMTGMREDPQHWALKASFGATVCRRPNTAASASRWALVRPASGSASPRCMPRSPLASATSISTSAAS